MARRASASASSPKAARRRAKAQSITDASGRRSAPSPPAASGRPSMAPIAMGYVETAFAEPGTPLQLDRARQACRPRSSALPFVPHSYKR